jgi:hypothetical protein
MDPIHLNPILPVLPDLGPSLLGPLLAGGLVALAGLVAVIVRVVRGLDRTPTVRRRRPSSILDGVARSVVEGRRPLRVDPGPARSSK